MANRDKLVRRALAILGVDGGAGQEPAAEDYIRMDEAVPSLIDDLAQREVVYIADVGDFPDAMLEWLAILLSQRRAMDFGTTMDAGAIDLSERRLRAIASARPSGVPARPLYF